MTEYIYEIEEDQSDESEVFIGLIVEIVDELKGIRKALETIVRSVSIYEIKDNS